MSKPAQGSSALLSTLKHGSIYTLGVILSRLIGFVMIPVYTRMLSTSEYGVLEILSTTTDLVSLFVGAGLGWAVMRYYFRYDSPEDRNAVISTAALTMGVIFVTASLIGQMVAPQLAELLLGDRRWTTEVRLSFLVLFTASTIEVPMAYLRARHRSTNVVRLSLTRLLIGLGCNLVFVVGLKWGVRGVLTSSLIASSTMGAWLTWTTLRETRTRFSPEILRKLVAYGAPLILWQVGSFVLHYSDRYFLRSLESLAAVGTYSLAYKIAMLLAMLVTSPFGQAWTPKALELDKSQGAAAYPALQEIAAYFGLLVGTVALGFALFGEELVLFAAGPAYQAAAGPIPVIILGMAFFGLRQVAELGAMLKERSSLVAASTGSAAVLVILLNATLIPLYGAMGAAVATAVAFMFEFSMMTVLSRRVHPIRFRITTLVGPILIAAVVVASQWLLVPEDLSTVWRIITKVGFLGLYAVIVWLVAMNDKQRLTVREALRDPMKTLRQIRGGVSG